MAQSPNPEIGEWYQGQDGLLFRVVAIEDESSIEIQYFEGDVGEIDFDVWDESAVKSAAPPEDWSGAYGGLEQDDLGYTDMNRRPEQAFSVDDLDK